MLLFLIEVITLKNCSVTVLNMVTCASCVLRNTIIFQGNVLVTLSLFFQAMKKKDTKDIKIRVIEVILDNGTKEYLATNLFDSTITQSMFQELYFYRWPVELKYKELKSRLAIEEFSGATTTSVFQEFYINMLLSNLSSLIKKQANRAFIIGFMKRLVSKILCTISTIDEINILYSKAVRNRSQIMPGRTFKRKKNKAKGRTHFNHQKVSF